MPTSFPRPTWSTCVFPRGCCFRERYGLEFLGEAFNLANHPNVTTANASAYFVNDVLADGLKNHRGRQHLNSVLHAVQAGDQHQ